MQSVLRAARIEEAAGLGDLCRRSKAHWGYDVAFMAQCHDSLAVPPAAIAAGRVCVAVDAADRPLGVAQIEAIEGVADLDKLFVEPGLIARGVGRALFGWALAAARAAGHDRITILADPHAAAFYRRMGATFLRMAPSDAISGRALPLYEFRL